MAMISTTAPSTGVARSSLPQTTQQSLGWLCCWSLRGFMGAIGLGQTKHCSTSQRSISQAENTLERGNKRRNHKNIGHRHDKCRAQIANMRKDQTHHKNFLKSKKPTDQQSRLVDSLIAAMQHKRPDSFEYLCPISHHFASKQSRNCHLTIIHADKDFYLGRKLVNFLRNVTKRPDTAVQYMVRSA